ncbi:cyclophane-forming radical SAM/SPASM peptide maturase YhhB, partial [Endozoicomonas sp. ALC013]|uniref:cyclophane-forming radical SAM/SPASM peptide maturase YhhB n=1 Tax=Endozoicomonas sp. ALC013 TaxID=3403076 RepID=UPI003BB79331
LDTVLIKAASRCNLDCSYCYVYQGKDTSWEQQPKRMSVETIKVLSNRLIEQSLKQKQGFAIVLHGGEPLLLGYDRLKLLLTLLREKLDEHLYPISLQTNGGLLTNKLLDLFSSKRVSVSVSIDGNKYANDIARVGHNGKSTFASTIQGIKKLSSHKDSSFLFAGTLSVIQPSVSPSVTYKFLKSLNTPSMDFLFQDGNHDYLPKGKLSFDSLEYGTWMTELLGTYLSDPEPPKIPSIDDIIKLSLGGESSKEGRGEESFGILIVETDGEIRKNDTLRLSFDGADFFSTRKNISNTPLSVILDSPEFIEASKLQQPTAKECAECPVLKVCGGGMPLYRWSAANGYNNPSVFCKDHRFFIENISSRLESLNIENVE